PSEFELQMGDVGGWVIGDSQILFGFLAFRTINASAEMELLNLAVGPNWRRKGCASVLLNAALSECQSRGIKAVFLEVRESNTRAIAFYKKHTFDQSARRPNYSPNPDHPPLTIFPR